MAPKRKAAQPQPARRSARLASREPSVASEAEGSSGNNEPGVSLKPSLMSNSKQPVPHNPYPHNPPATKRKADKIESDIQHTAPRKKPRAAPLFVAAVIARKVLDGDVACINTLTMGQLKAVLTDIAEIAHERDEDIMDLERSVKQAEKERQHSSLRRDFKKQEIMERHAARMAEESREREAQATPAAPLQESVQPAPVAPASASAPAPAQVPASTPRSPPFMAPPPSSSAEQPLASTPKDQQIKLAQSTSSWRNVFTSFGGYFSTPFSSRKRVSAPEEEAQESAQRSQKRPRIQEPPTPVQPSGTPSKTPRQTATPRLAQRSVQKSVNKSFKPPRQVGTQETSEEGSAPIQRIATPKPAQKSAPKSIQKSSRAERQVQRQASMEKDDASTTQQMRPRRVSFQDTNSEKNDTGGAPATNATPKPATPDDQGQKRKRPASHFPKEPSSLSTISEWSETSAMPETIEATPSKPTRATPQQQSTTTTRTPASLRRQAAHRASLAGTPRYSLSRSLTGRMTPQGPRGTNADARYAKLERMRILRRELEELEQDADVVEMNAHRRKRVKVDDLISIPHNRPGDSVGTFRVPDWDSDDEMEVDDNAQVRTNVFAAGSTPGPAAGKTTAAPPQPSPSKAKAAPAPALAPTSAPTATAPTLQSGAMAPPPTSKPTAGTPLFSAAVTPAAPSPAPAPAPTAVFPAKEPESTLPLFDFPHVASKPANYSVSTEYQEAAGDIFGKGLAEWLAV